MNKTMVNKHGLPTYLWESPSVAPIQRTIFVINTACDVVISLFNVDTRESHGVLDSFLFELLLGYPYLRKTPFLIECQRGMLIHSTNKQSTTMCLITIPTPTSNSKPALQGPKSSGGTAVQQSLTTRDAITPGVATHQTEY